MSETSGLIRSDWLIDCLVSSLTGRFLVPCAWTERKRLSLSPACAILLPKGPSQNMSGERACVRRVMCFLAVEIVWIHATVRSVLFL